MKNRRYYFTYTFLFGSIAILLLCLFAKNNKSLIWFPDGIRQHYIALSYLGNWGREIFRAIFIRHNFQIPLWDFNVGYGSDIITTFHYYVLGEPLNLLSILVPQKYTEYLYAALILLRMYLAGISFSSYCFFMGKSRTATLCGALNYVFCGYMLNAAVRHPFFATPMIYLPLLLIGAERIFRREKPTLFVAMVFLSAISNFYFFYMIVFAVCFYVGVRFFCFPHANWRKEACLLLGRFTFYGIVGVCMSAVVLLPVLLSFFGSGRLQESQICPLFYSDAYYKNYLECFLTTDTLGKWSFLGFTAPALLALFVLFSKRKQLWRLKVPFLVMTGMLFLPVFGKIMNGFSYISNRWCWIYAALISYILVTVWQDMILLQNTSAAFTAALSIGYFAFLFLAEKKLPRTTRLLSVLFIALFLFSASVSFFRREKVRFQLISTVFIGAAFLHICLNVSYLFGSMERNYVSEFETAGAAWERTHLDAPEAVRRATLADNSFFRCETEAGGIDNSSALIGVPGLKYAWSLENPVIADYLMDMASKKFLTYIYRDLDHRTFPDALACVKYSVSGSPGVLPFGFTPKDTVVLENNREFTVYENQYPLPLGYTYDSYIPYAAYREMSPLKRQEAMLQGVVLEENSIHGFPKTSPRFTAQSLDYTITCEEGIKQKKDGSFRVKRAGASITLSFSGMQNCETYLSIRHAEIIPKKPSHDQFHFLVFSDTAISEMEYLTPYYRYYTGQKDFLVNMGYQEAPQARISIQFPRKGTYRFGQMEVFCQPMQNYPGQIAALKEHPLEQIKMGINTVTGKVDLPKDKILCLSIPYQKGWHATVDGVSTPLQKANTMYMALPVAAGSHTIQLSYRTPGLLAGIWISLIGWLCFGIIIKRALTFPSSKAPLSWKFPRRTPSSFRWPRSGDDRER